jgi:flavodoxin
VTSQPWWATHNVRIHRTGLKRLRHPDIGILSLDYDVMELVQEPGLIFIAYSAAPGTPAANGLALLASLAATRHDELTGSGPRAPAPLNRRGFLRSVLIGGAGTSRLALAVCTGSEDTTTRPPTRTPEQETAPMTSTSATGTLLAYFSRPGENYWYGDRRDLEIGNTEVLARMIAERTGCNVYRVDAADPYPDSYDDTVARNVREQDDDARPAIANPLPDFGCYDTVILASPIWNVRPPMIMSTLLEAIPLGGKAVPVTTHAMSGLGRAPEVYAQLAPDATIGEGFAVKGEGVADAGTAIDRWLQRALTN